MSACVDFVPALSLRRGDVAWLALVGETHATRCVVRQTLASASRVRLSTDRGIAVIERASLVTVPARGAR